MFAEKKATAERLLPFYNKLKKAWCKESCSPSLHENWPNENIAKGVMIESITDADNPTRIVYDPSHPDADKDGYVELPNVNVVEEMVNMVNASRAYEANITLAQTTKTMIQSAINI